MPMLSVIRINSPVSKLLVPLKAMCSRKCAMPCVSTGSAMEPTLVSRHADALSVSGSDTSSTWSSFGSVRCR